MKHTARPIRPPTYKSQETKNYLPTNSNYTSTFKTWNVFHEKIFKRVSSM